MQEDGDRLGGRPSRPLLGLIPRPRLHPLPQLVEHAFPSMLELERTRLGCVSKPMLDNTRLGSLATVSPLQLWLEQFLKPPPPRAGVPPLALGRGEVK